MREALLDTLVFALLAGLAFVPLETTLPRHRVARRSFATDLAFATLGALLTRGVLFMGVGFVMACVDRVAPDASWQRAYLSPGLASAFEIGLALVVFETMGYLYHRLAHRVPILWRLHQVHHSSETMDWLAGFRQHPLEIVLATLMQNAPLVLLGIPLGAHATVVVLLRVHTIFVHANVHVPDGPWCALLATPRFHHRHHARDLAPANFAALFPWLDRLFGTDAPDSSESFGLPGGCGGGFVGLLLHPFRRAPATYGQARPAPLGGGSSSTSSGPSRRMFFPQQMS